ncbi:MAG: DUF2325 domain-containing protein [Pseudomonadota bacterium]
MEKARKSSDRILLKPSGAHARTASVARATNTVFSSATRIRRLPTGQECDECRLRRDCPLAGQKVVVIGGLDRLEPGYREVVVQLGGRFASHDGHVCNGGKKLKKQVDSADLVVFFTSINSHAALSVIKVACKKKGIPLLTVRETGRGSLEKALRASPR